MTVEEFKAIVEAGGGEKKVIAITFDNSANVSFVRPHELYSHERYLHEPTACLKMVSYDLRNNPYYVWKHLDNIQAIHFASEHNNATDYDSQTCVG